jgi:hypothetical protein
LDWEGAVALEEATMTIPAWVLGTSVNYVGSQGFIPSRPGGSIVVSNTLKVTAISGASVTVAETVVTEGITRSGSFTFTPVVDPSYWGYQYWVDPSNPTESIVGPEGEKYSIQHTEIYDGVDASGKKKGSRKTALPPALASPMRLSSP